MAGLVEPGTTKLGTSSKDALESLREARRLLKTPEAPALEACVPHLETAIRYLTALEKHLRGSARSGGSECRLRGEVEEMAREIRIVSALLERSGRYYAGLGQLLAAASQSATYTAQGLMENQSRRPRLHVSG